MIKVKEEEKKKYFHMFEEFTHNIPVIYSSLEGQYDGSLYVDDEVDPKIAVLFTQFAFHFIAGDSSAQNVVDLVDDMIFKQYLYTSKEKEAIVFSPSQSWNGVLDEVFKRHNGIRDERVLYKLDRKKFYERYENRSESLNTEKKIALEKENGSSIEYPICRVFVEQTCVSFCSGFMLGNGHAEIDVATEEEYRGLGYAKEAAFSLINELLKDDIEPNWCSWACKEGSRRLAESLGYDFAEEIPAHIWVEDECGKIV
ncbi:MULTISPECIES: GNAT family N-acetyltransferase [unclassified Fusibacter]|uniref:GNAT family N-acetyltransferase n=1 Tax=unclassified Fusibacter TaxID=2624464 RepID=UPI001013AFEF|nr:MULTISPECIES: GNAT family N-acetyltransferase [unclassified Fusibacter]MCK8060616.1 GNAT family N-acetyltransferase [Fusibacter sp. A2]NPE22930.1 GNAT family N-acetyltransferase [Fusibacter sp. A1]RXV59997.1 GNAT family N-acetyltransferase [Fusibacter sp. A1]